MTRILIAEDEARIASFVEKGLTAAGFAVTAVGDGRVALAEARSGQFDLLILDIGLPGLDGFDILETLRGEGNPIAVIVLTARDSGADTVRGLELLLADLDVDQFRLRGFLLPVDGWAEGDRLLVVDDDPDARLVVRRAKRPLATLVLTHGAGGGIDG